MYREQVLGALVRVAPDQAKAQILEAYRRQEGLTVDAAQMLGVGRRTLQRWVKLLALHAQIDRIRRAAGARPASSYNPGGMRPKKKAKRAKKLLRQA